MAQDAVKKVIEAEEAAAGKLAEARERAKRIVADAERAGKEALTKAEADGETAVKARLAELEKAVADMSDDIAKQQSVDAEKLEALALGKLDVAAAVIAERVVKG